MDDGTGPLPPDHITKLLRLNLDANKQRVAMAKILAYHGKLDMKPLFEEWELQLLPYVADWIDIAKARLPGISTSNAFAVDNIGLMTIRARKLDAMFQFVRGMPDEMAGSYIKAQNAGKTRQQKKQRQWK